MRVAVVAGPDPGHAVPATALCLRLRAAGHETLLYTGPGWLRRLSASGLDARELPGLAAAPSDPDLDLGARLYRRAAGMAPPLADLLAAAAVDVVVADTLTVAGGFAAELCRLPWVELVPHPLALPSAGLPPPGTGLAPGRTPFGRARDATLRRVHARSLELGRRQQAAARTSIGLPAADPGPARRLVATLPALEPPRPDWPERTHLVGPLHWDPAAGDLAPPAGRSTLVLVVPSTAASGRAGLLEATLAALAPLAARGEVRLAATVLDDRRPGPVPPWAAVGPGRQAPLLGRAAVVVCGGGHGMVSKALERGRPLVVVPGGGDQRELARRVARLGAGVAVERAATPGRLARAVRRLLADPGYAAAAAAAGATGRGVTDPVRWCADAATSRAE